MLLSLHPNIIVHVENVVSLFDHYTPMCAHCIMPVRAFVIRDSRQFSARRDRKDGQ